MSAAPGNSFSAAQPGAAAGVVTTAARRALVMPGESDSVSVEAATRSDLRLSVASMLAATNDAFTGVADQAIGALAVGETMSLNAPAYDAGTEAHTETAATVPALGGEGQSAGRDDLADFVSIHAGVVTADDGLSSSDLDESHRFIGPVAKITITRTQ